jgi:RNA polymerase sigma factor (TIGR02999 family)
MTPLTSYSAGSMVVERASGVTELLAAARNGDSVAIGQLYALLYPELKEQAHKRVRGLGNMTVLDTTSLVHESYLRLAQAGKIGIENRDHFLAYAAHVMRSVVIDYIRRAAAQRRGGDHLHISLNSSIIDSVESPADEIMRLHELLEELAAVDTRLVTVVEMRYFAALEADEIAKSLGVSRRTVTRDLEKVRLLLMDARA